MRLVLSRRTTDEARGMLVRRFPAVVSLQVKSKAFGSAALTDKGLLQVAVSSLTALTSLDLTWCREITYKGLRAVRQRNCPHSNISASCGATR
jgi:hypothetical protein